MQKDDVIYRQDAVREIANHLGVPAENWMKIAEEWLRDVPSAQPEEIALHESCTDCPLYDKNRHSCPRFNKVIPEVLREVQSDKRLEKIADLVDGTIDHFDRDDAMDLLYQIKEVINER